LQITEFTLLTFLYCVLLWAGLAGKIPRRWHVLSFLLQASCVFAISLVVRQDNVVLSLYLVLILEAIDILQDTRLALLVASSTLVLFVFNELLSRGILKSWTTALVASWVSTDYAALTLFLVGYLLLYLQLSRAHTQLATAHTELEEAHQGLSEAATQIAALTRQTERQRLARELHDTFSQGLVGLKLQLDAIDALLLQHQPGLAQQVVRQAMGQIQHTLTEARSAIDDLRNIRAGSHNLKEAVQEVVEHFTSVTTISCQMDLAALEPLPVLFHEQVLKFIGEGLTNIARHAYARQVWITTSRTNELFHLELRDDGIGFDIATVARQPGHYGLLGLRERARLIGGSLEIQSGPGVGTCLRLSLPESPESIALPPSEAKGGDL
jgi:two-component system, NarL family, sensor histidine kinase YdfH